MTDARARTRRLIDRHLGLDLRERVGDAYRDPSGTLLEGEWLGAFVQPSVVLNQVTPVSVRLAGAEGWSIDEYGKATLEVAAGDHGRVRWTKRYAPSVARQFEYVGRIEGGTLAGYWVSTLRPSFGGVFWLVRADRLPPDIADRLRARVRRSSPRRSLLKGLFAVVVLAAALGIRVFPPLAFATLVPCVVFVVAMRTRTDALRHEVERWKRQLG